MKKTLIFYKPEYANLAINLRDNYRARDHAAADIVSVEEHDDIEYAEEMQYDEAVFLEDNDSVTFHDINLYDEHILIVIIFCLELAFIIDRLIADLDEKLVERHKMSSDPFYGYNVSHYAE